MNYIPMEERRVRSAEEFIYDECIGISQDGMTAHFLDADVIRFASKEEWLAARKDYLCASDAPTVEGLTDAWRNRKDLYDEKTGGSVKEHERNELMDIGNAEEGLVRALIAIEHPEWKVYDLSNTLFVNRKYRFAAASLDAIAVSTACHIVHDIEIKCVQWSRKWDARFIPDNYFVQLLWQSLVTGIKSLRLYARVRSASEAVMTRAKDEEFVISAFNEEVEGQMDALLQHGKEFWSQVSERNYFPSAIRI